jgi:hypothetical protein
MFPFGDDVHVTASEIPFRLVIAIPYWEACRAAQIAVRTVRVVEDMVSERSTNEFV